MKRRTIRHERNPYSPDEGKDDHHDSETVALDESFLLFPPHRTVERVAAAGWGHDGVPGYSSQVVLDTDYLFPPLPVQITTLPADPLSYQALTPFATDGYRITGEDFAIVDRERKLAADWSRYEQRLRSTRSVLGIFLAAQLCPTDTAVLAYLHLQVSFPGGLQVEAQPDTRRLPYAYVRGFYPSATGPLASRDTGLLAGLQLAVPENPALLAGVKARFVLSSG